MLLLVMQTQLQYPSDDQLVFLRHRRCNQVAQPLIHEGSIRHYLRYGWPRKVAALSSGVGLAYTVVVGIEQVLKFRMKYRFFGQKLLDQECFKEPAGMSEVPLRRARI